MAKYGKAAQRKVERALHKEKKGTLKSGRSGQTVKNRKQAIAIGLSEARRAGGKVPKKASKKTTSKTGKKPAKKTMKKATRKMAKKRSR